MKSEENFTSIKNRAEQMNMRVNTDKTQLLCVSANQFSNIKSYIRYDNTEMQSVDELKILGFWFGSKPNVDVHINKLCEKFRSKLWILRKLRKAGMDQNDLLTVFKTVIRTVADFASPTYHSLLNKSQTTQLEQLQRRALKIIYGHDIPYSECLEKSGITTLEEGGETLTKNFAVKTAANHRFSDGWFPKKTPTNHNTRNPQKYIEHKPRTERMKKNPITDMRHLLNNI